MRVGSQMAGRIGELYGIVDPIKNVGNDRLIDQSIKP